LIRSLAAIAITSGLSGVVTSILIQAGKLMVYGWCVMG
jgi:hypothetical protein